MMCPYFRNTCAPNSSSYHKMQGLFTRNLYSLTCSADKLSIFYFRVWDVCVVLFYHFPSNLIHFSSKGTILANGAIGGCLHVTRSPEWWVWEVFWPPGGCSTAFWERRGKVFGWIAVCNQPCWRSCWERKDQSDRIHGSEKLLKA